MDIVSAILAEARTDRTLYLFAALVLLEILPKMLAPGMRKRLHGAVFLFVLHALLVPVAGILRAQGSWLPRALSTRSCSRRSRRFLVATFCSGYCAAHSSPGPSHRQTLIADYCVGARSCCASARTSASTVSRPSAVLTAVRSRIPGHPRQRHRGWLCDEDSSRGRLDQSGVSAARSPRSAGRIRR